MLLGWLHKEKKIRLMSHVTHQNECYMDELDNTLVISIIDM